jgi:hypothetical protein
MGNVFGETPNRAGEDARAPQYSGDLAATVFMEVLSFRGSAAVPVAPVGVPPAESTIQ